MTKPVGSHVLALSAWTLKIAHIINYQEAQTIYYWCFFTDEHSCFIIVAFLEKATIGCSLESVCVCLCVCVCFCTITQKEIDLLQDYSKRNRSRNTKSEYIVVYENSSDIELQQIKVKVTVGVQKFSPFTTIQNVRS